MRHIILAGALAVFGCLERPAVECAGNMICAADTLCDPTQRGCVFPEQLDCQGQSDESPCTYPGVADGACFDGVCRPAGCGNGKLEDGESCDDGNRLHGDGCAADCRSDESCGNGVIDATVGEACDDGNNDDADGCQANCASPTCGDGVIDAQFNEACDDGAGNSEDADARCRTNCQVRRCGDGVEDDGAGESCDDGNVLSGDGCSSSCAAEECGNGLPDVVERDGALVPAEECDDGEDGLSHDGCASLCRAELPAWREQRIPPPATPIRNDIFPHPIAYDSGRGRTVIVGTDGQSAVQTWEWDGVSWFDATPASAGDSPPELEAPAMTFDAARHQVVLFGGERNGRQRTREVWLWDGSRWRPRTTETGPEGRVRHAMAYDAARQRVVLYGGFGCPDELEEMGGCGPSTFPLEETWEWDGERWVDVSPADGEPTPGPRDAAAMTYDAARGVVLLIGGSSDDALWSWDGTAWTELDPAPDGVADVQPAFVYDAVRSRAVLVQSTMQMWDGAAWSSVAISGPPVSSSNTSWTYDVGRDRIIALDAGRVEAQTFEFDGTSWSNVSLFTGDPAEIPAARNGHAMAFDGRQVILFGGEDAAGVLLGDTWRWDGFRWKQLSPIDAPTARRDQVMAFDASSQRIVLLGADGETWEWDGVNWSQRSGGPSGDRSAMAHDSERDRTVVVVGSDFGAEPGDTFEWDGSSWSTVSTEGPSGRQGHAMAYDIARRRVVLFGGGVALSGFGSPVMNGETWEWDGATWTEIKPVVAPAPREEHTMVYDPARERVLLFGGRVCTGFNECSPLDDAWEWDGASWVEITQPAPARRAMHAMAYDGARGRTVMFGGIDDSTPGSEVHFADTWTVGFAVPGDEFCMSGGGVAGGDADLDGLVGCADPDCWAACTPTCEPGSTPQWPSDCDPGQPHCGDGMCDTDRETCALCPGDCGDCQVCGDLLCEGAEDETTCPGDCTP